MLSPYYQTANADFTLYQGDTMQLLGQIDKKIDMIFADPPYFLSSGDDCVFNGTPIRFDKGSWDRKATPEIINNFNKSWLALCREKLKDGGTIWISGTYHNIYSVANCLTELGYKILNMIVWHKPDAHPSLTVKLFNFSAEYIIWARKSEKPLHYFNYELMKSLAGGKQMQDVWEIPTTGTWEKTCGRHPAQKTLRLLYRILLSCTHEGDTVLDPFAGSCTTGIAANLLGRKFIGIDQAEEYLQLGIRRRKEIEDKVTAEKMLRKMSENPEEVTVLVNHARPETRRLMIEKGICYLRAGESEGSLQVTPGFEKMRYVLLHTNGDEAQLFKLKKAGTFQIWTKETLQAHGFNPEHATYYIVLPFDPTPIEYKKQPNIKQRINTYRAKIRPLSDFIGIK
ncbi:MAG: site-specific DNA-methyltransferase [Paludibacteraceae bacterium]|nr:site-specific DNA-methyltransferase [Paludibacteraceae bacterium]